MSARWRQGLWAGLLFWLAWWAVRVLVMSASGAGLHVDEAQYWWWSTELDWGYYSKPPMIAALIHGSTVLFGDGLVGVRALGMACWLGASALIWRWGVSVGASRAGWVAALLLAATPLSGILGLVVTTDGPLVLCWVLIMWGTWTLWQDPPEGAAYAGRWALVGLAFGLALLSKYTALIAGASWLLLWWWSPPQARGRWFAGLCLASAVGLLMLAPNLWWNASNDWPTLQHTLDITVRAAEGDGVAWGRHLASGAEFAVGQLFLLGPAFALLALWAWRRRHAVACTALDGQVRRWVWAFALPLLAVGLLQALRAKAQVNWAAPALVSLCWGLGWWVARVQVPRRAVVACVGLGVALSLVLALGGDLRRVFMDGPLSERNQWDVWARMRGWHEVLGQLKVARDTQDRGLPVVVAGRTDITEVAYEWRDWPSKPWAWNDAGLVESHFDWWRHLDAAAHPVVLLVGQSIPPRLAQAYPQATRLASAHSGRVRLSLWRLQAPGS
jgi:4-amino-4-deoxy-L-arabinose transferase-like glycosyltransferase